MYQKLYSDELNTSNPAYVAEQINAAEKLKVEQAKTPTFTEKIINYFRKVLYGQ
jgi:hypothetical protein